MKPTRNHKFCIDCRRAKMLFPTEKKANRCIEMNGDEIYKSSGRRPIRAYYCIACGGWHITSKKAIPDFHSPVELYFIKQNEIKLALRRLSEKLPGISLEKALKSKVGYLSRLIMRKRIYKSKCETAILQLIDIFDDIINAKLANNSIRKSFKRFCNLCETFQKKVTKGKIQPEYKYITA